MLKEKVTLTEAYETLLVPLYCRARQGGAILTDQKAEEIIQRLDYDFASLRIPNKTCVTVNLRASRLDFYTREFIHQHPDCVVIQLGCGLDSRLNRINAKGVTWFDLDVPDVIELRGKFYTETDRYSFIASSVTDLKWIDNVPDSTLPTLIIAEGLLMYLEENDVKALVERLSQKFKTADLVFDAFSELTARHVTKHPSLHKTGAKIGWGIDDPKTIERWIPAANLKEEWFFTQSDKIDHVGLGFRLGFKLAGFFSIAKRAHRILYYTLHQE